MNNDPANIARRIRRPISVAVVLIGLAFHSTAQTISFNPKGDSLSFWGTCTPPGLIWHLFSDSSGTDKVVIHRYACELIHGLPTNVTARFDSAWFSVSDSLNCNSYQLWLTSLSTYNGGTFNIPPDDIFYVYSGPIILKLLVMRQSIPVDSATVVGFAYQTGLAVEDLSKNLPGSIRLRQTYPTPFNSTTTVTYELSTAGQVDLQVFDLLGRKIQLLQSGFQSAGVHILPWAASSLPSGSYFIILNAAGRRSVIKCQLLK